MDVLQSKSVLSSGMVILVAILVSIIPQLEPVQTEMFQLLMLIATTLIVGHKGKDIMLAKYATDSPGVTE